MSVASFSKTLSKGESLVNGYGVRASDRQSRTSKGRKDIFREFRSRGLLQRPSLASLTSKSTMKPTPLKQGLSMPTRLST